DAVMPGEVGGANLSQDAPGDHPRPHPASVLVSRTLDRRSVGCCALMANTTAAGRPARSGPTSLYPPLLDGVFVQVMRQIGVSVHGDPPVVHPPNPQVRVQYPSYPSYLTITLIEIYLYIYGGPLHEIYIRDPYTRHVGTARWWIWWILLPDLRVRCEIAMDRRWIWWIHCSDLQ